MQENSATIERKYMKDKEIRTVNERKDARARAANFDRGRNKKSSY